MLNKVGELLKTIRAAARFATRRTSPAGDLHLEVRGVGSVAFPVSRARARKLCAVAEPARYGPGSPGLQYRPAGLRGREMLVGLEIKGPAPLWLDVELMREGLPPALKLFRTDRLSPFQPSHLENVLNLVATHNELSSGPNSNEP